VLKALTFGHSSVGIRRWLGRGERLRRMVTAPSACANTLQVTVTMGSQAAEMCPRGLKLLDDVQQVAHQSSPRIEPDADIAQRIRALFTVETRAYPIRRPAIPDFCTPGGGVMSSPAPLEFDFTIQQGVCKRSFAEVVGLKGVPGAAGDVRDGNQSGHFLSWTRGCFAINQGTERRAGPWQIRLCHQLGRATPAAARAVASVPSSSGISAAAASSNQSRTTEGGRFHAAA
jgi:hypothetical protein